MIKKYTLWKPITREMLVRASEQDKKMFPNREYVFRHVGDELSVVSFNTKEEAIEILENENNLGVNQFSLVSLLEVYLKD